MTKILKKIAAKFSNSNSEISCGNCWGHQEYEDNYVEMSIDITKDKKDNFISKFVKRYIR